MKHLLEGMNIMNVSIALLIRLALVMYGILHDKFLEVKYTDVDYTVFTDAADHIVNGGSPYLTPTYKYTPVLAFLLTPNILLHPLFGKIFFCFCDVLVIVVMERIFRKMKKTTADTSTMLIVICWTFNPFTMTISSRGNAESFQMLLVLLSILFVMQRRLLLAGIFYGFSVHFKLYPIIYALPFLLYIGSFKENQKSKRSLKRALINAVFSLDNILFGLTSLAVFCLLGGAMYYLYEMEFVENTYLFHFTRKDTQHNFSPYFYILRLAEGSEWASIIKTIAFLPQLISVFCFGLRYFEQLPLVCFLQTFAFVALNKVCTSQYFIWYIGLFPLAYPFMELPWKRFSAMVTSWFLGQGIWLCFAYFLEFKKYDFALYVWLASILFCFINMVVLFEFTRHAEANRYSTEDTIRKDK